MSCFRVVSHHSGTFSSYKTLYVFKKKVPNIPFRNFCKNKISILEIELDPKKFWCTCGVQKFLIFKLYRPIMLIPIYNLCHLLARCVCLLALLLCLLVCTMSLSRFYNTGDPILVSTDIWASAESDAWWLVSIQHHLWFLWSCPHIVLRLALYCLGFCPGR